MTNTAWTEAPEPSDMVRFGELRTLLRLAGELRELPRGSTLQKRHALEGLCALVGAQVGVWITLEDAGGGRVVLGEGLDIGWSGPRERQVFMRYLGDQSEATDPSMAPLARALCRPFCTARRADLVDDATWYRSDHVQQFRRAAGVDHFIYAGRRAQGSDRAHGLSLHRPWGERPFSAREQHLVDAFYRECDWLHVRPPLVDEALLAELPPRLRDTLRGLARGLGEKQLAGELGLSPHTLHGYVKALYRRLRVASRAELLSLCLATR